MGSRGREPFEPRPDWSGIIMRINLAGMALCLIVAAAVCFGTGQPIVALAALLAAALVAFTWRRMPRLLSRRQREEIGRQRRAKMLDLERQLAKMREEEGR
jgi:uncharacterized membrane protein